jgi:hypothetical protein
LKIPESIPESSTPRVSPERHVVCLRIFPLISLVKLCFGKIDPIGSPRRSAPPGPRIRYGLDEVGENEMRAFPARQIRPKQKNQFGKYEPRPRSSIFGGWGTQDRGRALAYENRLRFYCGMKRSCNERCSRHNDAPSISQEGGCLNAMLQKQFVITNCRHLRAIICCGNKRPQFSWGVGGWG